MTQITNDTTTGILGWENLLQLASQAIVGFNLQGQIVLWNERCQVLFGYSREEVQGRAIAELIIPTAWSGAFTEEISGFESLSAEHPYLLLITRGKNKTGKQFALKMNIFKIQVNNQSVFTSFVSVETPKQNNATANSGVELMKKLGHDVKNALTTIQLLTQIALRNKELETAPRTKDFLTKIDSQSVKLGALLNDLLDISRIQSGRLALKTQSLDFKPFLEDIVAKNQPLLEGHSLYCQEVAAAEVDLDPYRIRQAIAHILEHGIKHLERLSGISIFNEVRAEDLEIRIHFDHPPFEGEEQTFVGLDAIVVTDTDQPLDPALYITARSIELHQGTITVQRAREAGTTVSVTLPLGPQGDGR